ncbi:MAG TPA: hypothetical protein VGI20_03010 [Rhizomicrobium sp.]
MHAFRWIVLTLLLAFLVYGLTQLGWSRVWAARPTAPGFYLVLLLQFFVQPAADLVIYRNLLRVGRSVSFLVMLRKRFLNNVMLDYSGEAYFFLWAKRNLDLKKGLLIHAVKDSNVLSAGAGLAMICLMLLALVVGGDTKLAAILPADSRTLALIGSLPILLCLALVTGGSKVTALSRSEVASTFGIHIARSVIALFLEFSAWWLSGALPSAGVCLEFVALRQVVTRLPLIPAKDLFFVGIGMAAAGFMNVSATKVAAALVMMTGFSQLQEFALVGFPWLLEQFRDKQRADQCPS